MPDTEIIFSDFYPAYTLESLSALGILDNRAALKICGYDIGQISNDVSESLIIMAVEDCICRFSGMYDLSELLSNDNLRRRKVVLEEDTLKSCKRILEYNSSLEESIFAESDSLSPEFIRGFRNLINRMDYPNYFSGSDEKKTSHNRFRLCEKFTW